MLRRIIERRVFLAMLVALATGAWGLRAYPVETDNVFLGLIHLENPSVFRVLVYGYTTLWFTTPYFVAALLTSLVTIAVYRRLPDARVRALPPYPSPNLRSAPSLVLGETHRLTEPGPSPAPTWLEIPQRGLYTGLMVVGAVGTGKTSACMYPYVQQLLHWHADDADRKIGGLVLEVKGDFCQQVRTILTEAKRPDDYLELGLDTGVCYNPLHNDLDPYAVAYAIATLLNNLFGKSKEPFWQQAYTDLIKFVILLRRLDVGYTTLAEVYRYVLQTDQIDQDIRRLKLALAEAPDVLLVPVPEYRLHCTDLPWIHWFAEGPEYMAHAYEAELEGRLAARHVP